VPAGAVVDGPVENASLFATVLGLLGVPLDQGDTALPAIPLDGRAVTRAAYSATTEGIRRVAPPDVFTRAFHLLRTRAASLVYSPMGRDAGELAILELFDLAADPGETANLRLSAAASARLAEMQELMQKAFRFARLQRFGFASSDGVDAGTRNALDNLGYTSGTPSDREDGELFPPGEQYE
jgi:arylsulfatase A-like enzyme